MQIKTLAEILAESSDDSASSVVSKKRQSDKISNKPTKTELFNKRQSKKFSKSKQQPDNANLQNRENVENKAAIDNDHFLADSSFQPLQLPTKKRTKKRKRFHPAANFVAEANDAPSYEPPEAQSIKQMLAEVKHDVHDSDNQESINDELGLTSALDTTATLDSHQADNLPSALKAYLRTPEQKQAEIDAIKAESRLRWLAFYYLSRREYGKAELKQKLVDKEQDPDKIDALLDEFEDKGYQSDYRTTLMLIRESIRKGRGRGHIKQEFYKKKINMPSNIDELIDMANTESDEFSEFINDDKDSLVDGVDWLKLAVTARTKKYGDNIPIEQKDKAKQLRFLQYRGFHGDICFQALNYTLDTLDERF